MMRKTSKDDLVGRRFGRLTATVRDAIVSGRQKWFCDCTCGTRVSVRANNLLSGNSKSCGCLNHERFMERVHVMAATHGLSHLPEYRVWSGLIARCERPSDPAYGNYGARGITVCRRWRTSFERFLKDMGRRPSQRHSIERADNDAGYSKQNCRWATDLEQNRNRRCVRMTMALARDARSYAAQGVHGVDIATFLRVSEATISNVINGKSWTE